MDVERSDAERDRQLVQRARKGDRRAFAELVELFQRRLFSVAFRITGNIEDSRDMVQQAFLNAYQNLHKFEGNSTFGTWIYRIVSNASLTLIKQRRRESGDEAIEEQKAPRADGLLALERKETVALVRKAIDTLPERQRLALIFRTYEGLSYQQIADILECSVGAVKANYFHAVNKMREELSSYVYDGEAI